MIEVETDLRSWGNSLGITIPHEAVKNLGLQPGEKIKVWIGKDENVFRETFGMFKTGRPVKDIMKEIDRELYDD